MASRRSSNAEPSWVDLPGSNRSVAAGAAAAGLADPSAVIDVMVVVRRKAALALEGPRLSRAALAKDHGASSRDVRVVAATLEAFGLVMLESDRASRRITFSGSVRQIESCFGVRLLHYEAPEYHYRGRTGLIRLPAALDGIVEGVFGLDVRPVRGRRRPSPSGERRLGLGARPGSFSNVMASVYNFPSGDGAGQTIGIVAFGGGFLASDITTYCGMGGTPSIPQIIINPADATPLSFTNDSSREVTMDVEVVAGVCPGAKIVVYYADQPDEMGWLSVLAAVQNDVVNAPAILSISYGNPETQGSWTLDAINQVNQSLFNLYRLGITVCVATGDDGSSDGVTSDGQPHSDFPASSPYVLAVGGTAITNGGRPDVVWKVGTGLSETGGGSGGGGVSQLFPRPGWQGAIAAGAVSATGSAGRCTPDISANADSSGSPYLVVWRGLTEGDGGTSASTPLIASLIALINADRAALGKTTIGPLAPLLYGPTSPSDPRPLGQTCCTDVVSGNNQTSHLGTFTATVGFDCCSGWGTPNGLALSDNLVARP